MALELLNDTKLTDQTVQRNHILANSVKIKKGKQPCKAKLYFA